MITDETAFNHTCFKCGIAKFEDDAITVFTGKTIDTIRQCGLCGTIIHTDEIDNAFRCPQCEYAAFLGVDEINASSGYLLACGNCGVLITAEEITHAMETLQQERFKKQLAEFEAKYTKRK